MIRRYKWKVLWVRYTGSCLSHRRQTDTDTHTHTHTLSLSLSLSLSLKPLKQTIKCEIMNIHYQPPTVVSQRVGFGDRPEGHEALNLFSPMAQRPLEGQSFLIKEASRSHSDIRHLVGLRLTSDQPDAETCTWQHTTLAKRHTRPQRDSNPLSQQPSCWDLQVLVIQTSIHERTSFE